ncbi:hypothetical protein MIR68_007258 [Amoeboaphelidium protococcarum]|nr:hypothetical protein MIR68_007258 [Amoeboaphelidium protococcarum]KAI3643877.1 hypothetical protein MP228_010041 [Amoeboaphelidium protococcarum]
MIQLLITIIFLLVGIALILHSGYSAAENVAFMKAHPDKNWSNGNVDYGALAILFNALGVQLPADVLVELMLGALFSLSGIMSYVTLKYPIKTIAYVDHTSKNEKLILAGLMKQSI